MPLLNRQITQTKPRPYSTLALLLSTTFLFMIWTSTLVASERSDRAGWNDNSHGPQLELYFSTLVADDVSPEDNFGLRGALARRGRFQLEGSLSRFSDDRVDITLADLSAKYYFRTGERSDLYVLAGPGLFYSSDLDAEELMLHVGFGAEFSLGQHLYLRPEIRGRWFAEDLDIEPSGDISLGLGWRF